MIAKARINRHSLAEYRGSGLNTVRLQAFKGFTRTRHAMSVPGEQLTKSQKNQALVPYANSIET